MMKTPDLGFYAPCIPNHGTMPLAYITNQANVSLFYKERRLHLSQREKKMTNS